MGASDGEVAFILNRDFHENTNEHSPPIEQIYMNCATPDLHEDQDGETAYYVPAHLAARLSSLSADDAEQVLSAFLDLQNQFLSAAVSGKPVMALLDTVILEDLRQPGRRLRALAVTSFFAFIRYATEIPVTIGLTPTICFEANGKKAFKSARELNICLAECAALLQHLGFNTYYLGRCADDASVRRQFESILRDEKIIQASVQAVKQKDWSAAQLEHSDGSVRFPTSFAADNLPRRKRLRYFSEWYLDLLLVSLAERILFEKLEGQRRARRMIDRESVTQHAKLLKRDGNDLKGLGDLELLSHCGIRDQHAARSDTIRVGLTFDATLRRLLKSRGNTVDRFELDTAAEDPFGDMLRFMRQCQEETDRVNARASRFQHACVDYGRQLAALTPLRERIK